MTNKQWKLLKIYFWLIVGVIVLSWISRPAVYALKLPSDTPNPAEGNQIRKIAKNTPQKQMRGKNTAENIGIDEILIRLMECENRERITNKKVLDVNSKYSYGILQFQKSTLELYTKRYGLRDKITEADLFNPSLQRETARRMIEESRRNLYHWEACAKIKGLIAKK